MLSKEDTLEEEASAVATEEASAVATAGVTLRAGTVSVLKLKLAVTIRCEEFVPPYTNDIHF